MPQSFLDPQPDDSQYQEPSLLHPDEPTPIIDQSTPIVEPQIQPQQEPIDYEALRNISQTPWYKTSGGKIFVTIAGIIIFIISSFSLLIGYYLIKIELGNEQEIVEEFKKTQSSFSSLTNKKSNRGSISTGEIIAAVDEFTPSYGPQTAPTTIMMFIDFECPYCKESYRTFRTATKNQNKNVRVLFKHFPLAAIHPNAAIAALAGECARDQGKFWEYYDVLFTKTTINTNSLKQYAKDINLDVNAFNTCYDNRDHFDRIQKDFDDGVTLGVRGTPTYIVNTKKMEGVITLNDWAKILK